MKRFVVVLLAFILLQSLSCVKKVAPSPENPFQDLQSNNINLYNSAPGGTVCRGMSIDGDTIEDFSICSYYFGGGQAQQSIFYAKAYDGIRLELNPTIGGLSACNAGSFPLQFRKAGETIITNDTAYLSKSGTYYYYVGAGTHGTALLGNCLFQESRTDTLLYIVLRKIEGSTISIGYLEVKKNKLTRFRKFKNQTQLTLPN